MSLNFAFSRSFLLLLSAVVGSPDGMCGNLSSTKDVATRIDFIFLSNVVNIFVQSGSSRNSIHFKLNPVRTYFASSRPFKFDWTAEAYASWCSFNSSTGEVSNVHIWFCRC